MPAEIPDEFIELLEALSEERLDEAGRARLVAMAAESPQLRSTLREHLALSRALGQLDRDDHLFAERTAAHVMKTASEGDFAFAGKVKLRILRRRVVKVLAAAAPDSPLLVVLGHQLEVPPQHPALLVGVLHAEPVAPELVLAGGRVRAGPGE